MIEVLSIMMCFRLATLCNTEDTSDNTDIELIQHINVTCTLLTRLLSGEFYCHFLHADVCVHADMFVSSAIILRLFSLHFFPVQ
jgi:hypothetical protein